VKITPRDCCELLRKGYVRASNMSSWQELRLKITLQLKWAKHLNSTLGSAVCSHHDVPPEARRTRAKQTWTKACKTASQNKPFLFISWWLQVFVLVMGSWLTQWWNSERKWSCTVQETQISGNGHKDSSYQKREVGESRDELASVWVRETPWKGSHNLLSFSSLTKGRLWLHHKP
jgi:hypothetical protein